MESLEIPCLLLMIPSHGSYQLLDRKSCFMVDVIKSSSSSFTASRFLLKLCTYFSGNSLELLRCELQLLATEVDIFFRIHGNQMDVGMGNFQS